MPATDTISVYRGEDVTLEFTMDPVEDVTGWTIALTIKGGGGVDITKTPATIVDGPNGVFQFDVSSADLLVPEATHRYDVWRTDAGSQQVLADGLVTVKSSVRVL